MSDVHDILELSRGGTQEISKASILGLNKPNHGAVKKKEKEGMKRPEGMHRELFALLYSTDSNKELAPLLQTDSVAQKGYKSTKARLGMRRARPWAWMPFVNPARSDGALLSHWRRVADRGKEYPFAQFNKKVEVLHYSDAEYRQHLSSDTWSRAHSDTLMELCEQFDLRWPVIQDRWPHTTPAPAPHEDSKAGVAPRRPSVEELKERYYQITNALKKARGVGGAEGKLVHYDAEHERKRKRQLARLWDRTPHQVEEERSLLAELRRIEARKRERDRKTMDLQRLIQGEEGEGAQAGHKRPAKAPVRPKKTPAQKAPKDTLASLSTSSVLTEGVAFPPLRGQGVSLRSQCLKVPLTLGTRRVKALEQMLSRLGVDGAPVATRQVVPAFNALRSDVVALYELRSILNNFVFELQAAKLQHDSASPDAPLGLPDLCDPADPSDLCAVWDTALPNTPARKRKASMEQTNILKKIKNRNP